MRKSIIIAICLGFSIWGASAQSMYVSSMKGNVNVRTAPSKTAPKAGSISTADLVPCIEEVDGWYKIDLNGKEAYVSQSVAATCEAVVPDEMFGKSLESSEPWDKIRHHGFFSLEKIDNNHAAIHMDWMRVNLPAESSTYIAEIKDGKVIATYGVGTHVDTKRPLKEILEEMGEPLAKPIPLGYDEFGNTLYFNGAKFSEYD